MATCRSAGGEATLGSVALSGAACPGRSGTPATTLPRAPSMTTARAFRGFRFPAEVILWAVRWYLQFPISYRLPEAKRAVGNGEFGCDEQTSVLQIEQQLPPILGALSRAVGEAEQLLPALRRRADDHQDALLGVFKTGLQVNAVGPHIDVALGRQIALAPVLVLVAPDLLQPRDGRSRQAWRILAEQGGKRLREIV